MNVLHHNFALRIYTGYTEVGHSPLYLYYELLMVCTSWAESGKMANKFFLMRNNILTIYMISDDSKGINNMHLWFDSITSSGKGCN